MAEDAAATAGDASPLSGGDSPSAEERPHGGATRRLIAFAALCVVVLLLVYYFRDIFAPVLAALAAAYMLDPLVRRLQKRGWTRKRAVMAIFAAATFATLALVAVSVPFVVRDIVYTAEKVEAALATSAADADGGKPAGGAESGVLAALKRHKALRGPIEWLEETGFRDRALKWVQENAREIAERTMNVGKAGLKFLSRLGFMGLLIVLFPVYLYFFMVGLGDVTEGALSIIPPRLRPKAELIATELGVSISAFFRGRLVVSLVIGIATATGFALIGLRFGIVLGLAIGIATIVPVLNVVFLIPALVIALADFQSVWWMAAVFGIHVACQILDPVLTPYLMSRGTGLHPVTIIVSLMVWGRLLGVTGLLLAVPLSAAIKILGRELVLPVLIEHGQVEGRPDAVSGGSGADAGGGQADAGSDAS